MEKSKYKVMRIYDDNTDITFETLLIKAINTYINNKENIVVAIHSEGNNLKYT